MASAVRWAPVLTGVFATRACADINNGEKIGLLESGDAQVLIGQIVAVAITWVLAILATYILLKVLDATMGLRVSQADEVQGLDLSQHGEEGYIL
ncbi:MAG: hypothetical protein R3C10_15245 [Pirellulales bacterium]